MPVSAELLLDPDPHLQPPQHTTHTDLDGGLALHDTADLTENALPQLGPGNGSVFPQQERWPEPARFKGIRLAQRRNMRHYSTVRSVGPAHKHLSPGPELSARPRSRGPVGGPRCRRTHGRTHRRPEMPSPRETWRWKQTAQPVGPLGDSPPRNRAREHWSQGRAGGG